MTRSTALCALSLLTAAALFLTACGSDTGSTQASSAASNTPSAANSSSTLASPTTATDPIETTSMPESPTAPPSAPADPATPNGDGSFCEVLLSDMNTSAMVFTVLVPGPGVAEEIARRKELLGQITSPPAELADDLASWQEYLDMAEANIDNPDALIAADPAQLDAATTLVNAFVADCMPQ